MKLLPLFYFEDANGYKISIHRYDDKCILVDLCEILYIMLNMWDAEVNYAWESNLDKKKDRN